jgi:hypothetical protein
MNSLNKRTLFVRAKAIANERIKKGSDKFKKPIGGDHEKKD